MRTTTSSNTGVNRQKLEQKVKHMYRNVALHPEVSYHFEMGRALAERLGYPAEELDKIPAEAIESFAGVGYYFDLLNLQKGERVLDLGSGSGMDVFFAANQVKHGTVIGIDMTDEQLRKAARLRNENDLGHIYFRKDYIENLSIASGTIDAVISNGVVNLSSDKAKVFQEAARILKPGGRLAIADIVSGVELPERISCNSSLWAACIGGAMEKNSYLRLIERAGFEIVETKKNPYAFLSGSAKGATEDYGIESISILAVKLL